MKKGRTGLVLFVLLGDLEVLVEQQVVLAVLAATSSAL